MFKEFFLFELKSWLKNPMFYMFFAINFLLVFFAVTNDGVTVGQDMGNVNINSPYAIMTYAAMVSLLSIVMTTALVNRSALKDFNYNFHSLLFSSPIQKFGYLMGRFASSVVVSSISLLGVLLALYIAPNFVATELFKVGPHLFGAYLNSFLLFILPNTILISAVVFSLAMMFRSTTATFVGSIGLLVAYLIAGNFLYDLDNETIGILADPLGINSLAVITKYWTLTEKNTIWLTLSGEILLNRIIWMSVAALIFAVSYFRFSFTVKNQKTKKITEGKPAQLPSNFQVLKALPTVTTNTDIAAYSSQLWAQVKSEFFGIVKSPAFIIIALFAIINTLSGLSEADGFRGTPNHPLTYIILDVIDGSLFFFINVIIAYYSGVMIWRERNNKMNEILDASPFPSWLPMASKYTALLAVVGVLLSLAMICGIGIQAIKGYYNFEAILYVKQLFLIDYSQFAILVAVAFLIQVLVNHQYLGYMVFFVFLIFNIFAWEGLGVNSNLLIFGGFPEFTYSDMTQFTPFVSGILGFKLYWILFALLLSMVSILFWVRGKGLKITDRFKIARQRFNPKLAIATTTLLVGWITSMGFLYYNTEVLNDNPSKNTSEIEMADYEKRYKIYEGLAQPRIVALDHNIEIFPHQRTLKSVSTVTITNKHETAIDSIHFTYPDNFDVRVDIKDATLVHEDDRLRYYIFQLDRSLHAGDSLSFQVYSDYIAKGIENEVVMERINPNGTFIQNAHIMPIIGYSHRKEMDQETDRKSHDLAKKAGMAKLEHSCSAACSNTYMSTDSDWINLSCTISTSMDEMAIAPGTLIKEWTEGDRKYFRYELDKPVGNYYAFLSAQYEVKREKWNTVDLEVYYHEGHAYNIDKMMLAMRKSLEYFDREFLPYPHQQARIIEFPRFSEFAQAFPGTMPCSESAGYISDLQDENDIDRVFYTVAHEMAHQWWAHQVIGAKVQGATMLSETFAQYSALMIMEKQYGKERIQQFLKYEMDSYLRGRGSENIEELPLMLVEDQQYIHYNKGSVVMYALREYLGEDALNSALSSFANRTAYQEPPYTTTNVFMQELEAVTPDSLNYLVEDLFKKIVFYNNKAIDANYTLLQDGRYEVTIDVEIEKYIASGVGTETAINFDDYIYIGVYSAPEPGSDFGKLLYYKQHKFSKKTNQNKVIVEEEPDQAGIDPINLLIDRRPEDNVVDVVLKEVN